MSALCQLDENENELWIDELRKLEEEKGNDIKMTPETKRGFFFCLETKQLVVRQKDGTEVYRREVGAPKPLRFFPLPNSQFNLPMFPSFSGS